MRVRRAAAPRGRLTPLALEGLLGYHARLLADGQRNRAFARALRARVRPGSSVLDIGAGTGLWAVLAARLGAARVVAVERDALLVPVIERLARENGVAERVRVVHGDARRIDLPRSFDVVVSETVGNEAFDEGIVHLMARARARFLRPGGALVPEAVSLLGAPARAVLAGGASSRPSARRPPVLVPRLLSAASIGALLAHVPRGLGWTEMVPLAPARELLRVDLGTARPGERLPLARARFRVTEGRAVGGLAIWAGLSLAPGVRLSARDTTAWSPVFLPIDGLPAGAGRLSVQLDWSRARRRWSVVFEDARGTRHVAEHAPLFAWGVLRAALLTR